VTPHRAPESKRHFLLRVALFDLLTSAYGDRAAIGSNQCVYWNARDPKVYVAPDAIVRLGHENDLFDVWNTWERGAPHVAVEIAREPGDIVAKLALYHELGVLELVAFDPDDAETPLRVWSRAGGDLVERDLGGARVARSEVLGDHWVVVLDAACGLALRLARDEAGAELLLTRLEIAEARVREFEGRGESS
jgi:hypothetical protein